MATATSWCSVHVSEWSSRPFQKGASRRSICRMLEVAAHWRRMPTYLQLAHDGLAEVLGPRVCAEGDEEGAVDALFAYASLALLGAGDAFLFEFAGLALSPRFAARL